MPKKDENNKGGMHSGAKKPKRMHLHEVRSVQAEDGSIVHHHTYKAKPSDMHTMPERGPVATSATPEEAGQHVQDQFAMNGQADAGAPDDGAAPEGGEPNAAEV